MLKNTAGQKYTVFAFNKISGDPVTGDSANILANIRINDGSSSPTSTINPIEQERGFYVFDLSQAETNGEKIALFPYSNTVSVEVICCPAVAYTEDPNLVLTQINTALNTAIPESPTIDSIFYYFENVSELPDLTNAMLTQSESALTFFGAATASSISALHNISTTDVLNQVASALETFDPPTKAEMDSALSLIATASSISALHNISTTDVLNQVASALSTYGTSTATEVSEVGSTATAIKTVTDKISTMIETTQGVSDFTINALKNAPIGATSFAV